MDSGIFNYTDGTYSFASTPPNSNLYAGKAGHSQTPDGASQGMSAPQGYNPAGFDGMPHQYAMYAQQYPPSSHGEMSGYPMHQPSRGGAPYGASEGNPQASPYAGYGGEPHPGSYYTGQMYHSESSSTGGGYPLRPQPQQRNVDTRSGVPPSQGYNQYQLNQPGYPPMGNTHSHAFSHSNSGYMSRAPYGTLRSSGEAAAYGHPSYPSDVTAGPTSHENPRVSPRVNPSRPPPSASRVATSYVHPAHTAPPPTGRQTSAMPPRTASPNGTPSMPPSGPRSQPDGRAPEVPASRPNPGNVRPVPVQGAPTGLTPPKKEENIEEFKIKAQSMKKQYLNRLEGMIKNMEDIKPSARSEDTKHKYEEIQKKLTLLRTLITADFKPNSNFPPRKEILEAAEKQIIMWINQWEKLEKRGGEDEPGSIDADSLDAMINQRFGSSSVAMGNPVAGLESNGKPSSASQSAGEMNPSSVGMSSGFDSNDAEFNLLFSDEFDFGDTLSGGYGNYPPQGEQSASMTNYSGTQGYMGAPPSGSTMGVNPSQLHNGPAGADFVSQGYPSNDSFAMGPDGPWPLSDDFSLGYKRSRPQEDDPTQGPPSKRDRLS